MTNWIEWKGGERPVEAGVRVEYQMREGDKNNESDLLDWSHKGVGSDIIAYRLHKPEAAEAPDLVNNPPHYKQGDIECIDAIKAALTEEEFRGYCKGNALKYIWRERHKGVNESLAKANWYIAKLLP